MPTPRNSREPTHLSVRAAGPRIRSFRAIFHPTMKNLALSFLVLIGMLLVAEGIGQHFPRGYVYFAMVFAICVELINMKTVRRKHRQVNHEA